MWIKSFNKVYQSVSAEAVWQWWADVNHWPLWDKTLWYCMIRLNSFPCDTTHSHCAGEFVQGAWFILKPKKGFKVKITLSEVMPNRQFVAYRRLLGAKIHYGYEMEETPEGLRITGIIYTTGWLNLIWGKLIAEKAFRTVSNKLDAVVALAKLR